MSITATVICDASYYHGEENVGYGGWAAWVKIDRRVDPIKGYGTLTREYLTSSSVAEIYAALNGIWLASRNGAAIILVRSDCMTVDQLIKGRCKSEPLIKIWKEAFKLDEFQGISLKSRHVKGHGQIKDRASWVNDWVDRKSREAMRLSRRGIICKKIL